jgi:hypothetical protein
MEKGSYKPLSQQEYASIKPGDVIIRMLAFILPMELTVTAVDEKVITAGAWRFDVQTGIEIDEDIPTPVSYISGILELEEHDE